jgi:hypothetical protein
MPLTAQTPYSDPLVDVDMIRQLLEQHRAARIDQIKAYTFADIEVDAGDPRSVLRCAALRSQPHGLRSTRSTWHLPGSTTAASVSARAAPGASAPTSCTPCRTRAAASDARRAEAARCVRPVVAPRRC